MDLTKILPQSVAGARSEIMSARVPMSMSGILGIWWSEARQIAHWDSEQREKLLDGRIEFAGSGWLRLHFGDAPGDAPGWRTFVSLRGAGGGTRLQCRMKFRFDPATGTTWEDDVPLNYDNALNRHVGIGPVSDGSLGQNSQQAGILLAHPAGGSWMMEQIVFGYVQLGDAS